MRCFVCQRPTSGLEAFPRPQLTAASRPDHSCPRGGDRAMAAPLAAVSRSPRRRVESNPCRDRLSTDGHSDNMAKGRGIEPRRFTAPWFSRPAAAHAAVPSVSGWGGESRTHGASVQSAVPYHLATPQKWRKAVESNHEVSPTPVSSRAPVHTGITFLDSAPGGIRTLTDRTLDPAPLPLGYRSEMVGPLGFEPRTTRS